MSFVQTLRAKDTIENTFNLKGHFDYFLTKPRADVIILGVEKDLTNPDKKIINKKISFRSNLVDLHTFDTFTSLEDDARAVTIQETYGLNELAIIGVSIDEASVYGKKAKVAFSDQKNLLWNTIQSGDIIVINTYLEGQDTVDVEDFILDDRISLNSYFEDLILGDSKVDFCGIVTSRQKDIKATDQVRIQATDFVRIMQQINVPIGKYYEKLEDDVQTKYCMEAVSSRFIEAFLNKISKLEIEEFQIENIPIIYEDLVNNSLGLENIKIRKRSFRESMDDITVIKTYQNSTGDKVIYTILANTLKIAEYILEYELEKIGLLNFMDVKTFIPTEFEKYYAEVFGNDMWPKNFVILNLYFGASADDELQVSDIMENKLLNLKDLKNSLMFYTLDKVYDFSSVNLHMQEKTDQEEGEDGDDGINDQMSKFISNNLFFLKDNFVANDDAQRVHQYMIDFKTELQNETSLLQINKILAFQQNRETINSINFNKFFFYLDYDKISIRSTKFKGEGEFKNSLPVTQIMMYALSLFVFRPKYFNPFTQFRIPNLAIPFYKSGKIMYSLSKMVWFESTIKKTSFFSNKAIEVIFFPVMTPMIVNHLESMDKANKEDEIVSTMINKSDFLEMQFNRYDVNDNVLQINTNYSTDQYDWKPQMVFSETDADTIADILTTKVSMFGDNTVDLQSSNTNYKITKHMKDYTDFVGDFYYDMDDFINNWSNRYPPIWYDADNGLSFYTGKNVTTGKNATFRVYNVDENKVGNNTQVNSYINIERLTSNFEDEQKDGETKDIIGITQYDSNDQLAIVIPAFEIGKATVRTDNLALYNKTKSAYEDMKPQKYKSRYQVKYYLQRTPIDAEGDAKVFGAYRNKIKTINFNIAGVNSVHNLQALRDAIKEEFTYSKGLPKEITDSIFLYWRKFDVKFDLVEGEEGLSLRNIIDEISEKVENFIQGDETIEREGSLSLLNLSDIEEYMNDILDFIEELTKDGIDMYPHSYTLYPDIQSILDFAVGDDGLKLTEANNQNKKEYMIALMKDLFTIIKNPVVVDSDGKVDLPDAYHSLKKIKFVGDMFIENKSKDNMELIVVNQLLKEIFTLSYLIDVFIQDILRKNNYSGSFFTANRGTRKMRVGQYLHINNDVRDGAIESEDIVGDITSLVTNIAINIAAKSNAVTTAAKKVYDVVENMLRDVDKSDESVTDAIYTTTVDYSDKTKPFGWFVWKTATYLGNASGDDAGTSGYNQKVYLSRDGVNYGSNFEEEDFLTSFIQDLQNNVFSVDRNNY